VVPTYDDDGNLLSDGRFDFEWDGENRLTRATMIEAPDPYQVNQIWVFPPKLRVNYTYDYMGRRVRAFVEKNQFFVGGVPVWDTESDTRYVYDGWNVVLELDGADSNAVRKQCTWGLDVSGSLQGAGGVGGLLACEDLKTSATSSDDVQYVYAYDGNGNVMALTDSAQNQSTMAYDGTELARYDYDPYGNVLIATGAEADANRYRFSTKPQDAVTELFYYGYRWYHAEWGRFINRDPIEESGGENIYCFVKNDPVASVDALGLKKIYQLRLIESNAQGGIVGVKVGPFDTYAWYGWNGRYYVEGGAIAWETSFDAWIETTWYSFSKYAGQQLTGTANYPTPSTTAAAAIKVNLSCPSGTILARSKGNPTKELEAWLSGGSFASVLVTEEATPSDNPQCTQKLFTITGQGGIKKGPKVKIGVGGKIVTAGAEFESTGSSQRLAVGGFLYECCCVGETD